MKGTIGRMSPVRRRGLLLEPGRRAVVGGCSAQISAGAAPIHTPLRGWAREAASGWSGSSLRCGGGGPALKITSG
jgi:hypothetical protein